MEVGGKVMGKLWSSQAFTFVADHTPANEEGLLTGLCLYTELWLAKVRMQEKGMGTKALRRQSRQ
eukprot:1146841-Pelagomonas_calceolata.AAC.10